MLQQQGRREGADRVMEDDRSILLRADEVIE
jgi:hypothetical protein